MNTKFVSVREAAARTGQAEAKIRRLIKMGRLRTTRVGYHILLARTELKKLRPEKAGN